MSTFLQLCQDFRLDVGIEGSGPTSVSNQSGMMAKIVYWVARADIEIQNKWQNWGFLHTEATIEVLNGVRDVVKPSDLGLWDKESFYLDGTQLEYITYEEWRDAYKYDLTTGIPWGFTVKPSGNIVILPVPDGGYTIDVEYWKAARKLTANASQSLIPEQYERAILAKASMMYAAQEEIPSLLQTAGQEFYDVMNRLEAEQLPGWGGYSTADNDIAAVIE